MDGSRDGSRAGRAVVITVLAVAVFLGVQLLHGLLELAEVSTPVASAVRVVVLVGATSALIRWLGPGSLRASLGRGCSVGALLLGIAAGTVAFVVTWVAFTWLGPEPGERSVEIPVVALVHLLVLAPLLEEWVFRGVVWTASTSWCPTAASVGLNSTIFALAHGFGGEPLAFVTRFVAGLFFTLLRAETGSLIPCIVAHAVHNGLVILFDL